MSLNVIIAGSPGGWVRSDVDEGDLRFHGLVEEFEDLVGLICSSGPWAIPSATCFAVGPPGSCKRAHWV